MAPPVANHPPKGEHMKSRFAPVGIFCWLAASGCDNKLGDVPKDGDESDEPGDAPTTDEPGGEGDLGDDGTVEPIAAVDILFVIDNSGSMAEEQVNLVANLNVLLDVLDQDSLDYRIGFTTTDNQNPLCPGTSFQQGRLRAVSCLDRLDEFVFEAASGTVDVRETCTSACTKAGLSSTDGMPWIERTASGTNLPADVTLAEAFHCLGLQGISGCGMESPLESMHRMIARSELAGEDEFGFFREGAVAAIAIVSDEADCSVREPSIFDEEGDMTFWSAAHATSAICWNAGVECSGGPDVYAECHSANKDIAGNVGVADEDAVLHPVSRYVEGLEHLLATRSRDVVVAALVGVPEGYDTESASIPYTAQQEMMVETFGIDPGCSTPTGIAVPPVRIREVAEAFAEPGERSLYSVCAGNYVPALKALAQTIAGRF